MSFSHYQKYAGTYFVSDDGTLEDFRPEPTGIYDRYLDLVHLWNLELPEGIRKIKSDTFRRRNIKTIAFPVSLEEIEPRAFSHCAIGSVSFPEGCQLKTVGADVFFASDIGGVFFAPGMDPQIQLQLAHALRFSLYDSLYTPVNQSWPEECLAVFRGENHPRESWQRLSSESGTFLTDADGVLREFWPDGEYGKSQAMLRLTIPEGIRFIPGEIITGSVLWEMTLPQSLRGIGCCGCANAFACVDLPDITLPKNLEMLGHFSFGSSRIRSLTVPAETLSQLRSLYLRQFKDSYIGELRLPEEYRKDMEHFSSDDLTTISDPFYGRLCSCKGESLIHGERMSHFLFHQLLKRIQRSQILGFSNLK